MSFPTTRYSAISGLDNQDEAVRQRSFEAVIDAYWAPVQKYLRLRWHENNEDASDLTQAFFTKSMESGTLTSYDAVKGTFRTYLRTCLDRFVLNVRKQKTRAHTMPLQFDIADPSTSPEELFRREWVRSLFSLALEDLREQHKDIRFQVFEKYDLNETENRPSYSQLAEEFGVPVASITNFLAAMRRDFRKVVLERLRELTVSEREFQSEVRAVFSKT